MLRTYFPFFLCVLALMGTALISSAHAQSQNQKANSAPPAKQVQDKLFQDVQRKSGLGAKIEDLQQKGFLQVIRSEYPGLDNGHRSLTRYEVAVLLQRMPTGMSIRTLSQDGTKLEYTFGIPRNLEVKQAQEMLDLWTAFAPELKQLGVQPNAFQRIHKTLELFIAVSNPNTIKDSDKPSDGKPVANPSL